MIIILKNGADGAKIKALEAMIRSRGIEIHESQGTTTK